MIEKGHENPVGMCTSILDLALGYLDDKNENENENENENNFGKSPPKSLPSPKSPSSKMKMNQNSPVFSKIDVQKNGLFEILRVRVNDDKPLVRVKAIQTLGAALGLNYPKRKQRRSSSTSNSNNNSSHSINSNSSSSKSRRSSKMSLIYQDEDRSSNDSGDHGKSNIHSLDVYKT